MLFGVAGLGHVDAFRGAVRVLYTTSEVDVQVHCLVHARSTRSLPVASSVIKAASEVPQDIEA
jgi:hypothetical protein